MSFMAAPPTATGDSRTSEQFLRIGDEVYFYDQNNNLLVAEDALETRACIRPSTHKNFLSSQDAMGTSIFRIEPQQSHSAQKELQLFIGDEDIESLSCEASIDELKQLKVLQSKTSKELAQNESEKRRLLGKPILYGQVIQLFNQHFQKYLTVTGKTCNKKDSSQHRLQVNLSNEFVGYFRIMPRYRIRFVGDVIRLGETIALQCVRPEGYLNVDYKHQRGIHDFHSDYYEVYSHTRISSWTMKLHYTSTCNQDTGNVQYTNAGQYIRLYHKEMEAYLESKGTQVVLKKHIINPLDPKETESPLAFWEIENVDISRGSKVRWKKPIRIRHVATSTYLSIDNNHVRIDVKTGKANFTLKLVHNPVSPVNTSQDTTLFQLVPVSHPPISGILYGSFVRIQHVLTDCWMHAANGEEEPAVINAKWANSPLSLSPTSATIPQKSPSLTIPSLLPTHHSRLSSMESEFSSVTETASNTPESTSSTFFPITASQELYYHDCFAITLVENDLVKTFNYANDMLPQLQWYLYQEREPIVENAEQDPYPIQAAEYESITNILKAIIMFCTKSKEINPTKRIGLPNEYHQTLLQDIGIIETIIQMIIAPFDTSKREFFQANLDHFGEQRQENYRKSSTGMAVDINKLNKYPKLRTILTLCYHLLRVFLVRKSSFESEKMEEGTNQQYVLSKAGEVGMSLFVQHSTYNIGASDMMVKLLEGRADIPNFKTEYSSIAILNIMMKTAINNTEEIVDQLNRIKEPPCAQTQEQQASCLKLLSALCQASTETVESNTNPLLLKHRNLVMNTLFDAENSICLLQTRTTSRNQVEIRLKGDEWKDLNQLLDSSPFVLVFITNVLELMYSITNKAHTKAIEKIGLCMDRDSCLKCLKNQRLPCSLRSKFCNLLRVLYVDIQMFEKVILSDFTIFVKKDQIKQVDDQEKGYPKGSPGIEEDFYQRLKLWIFRFLDTRQHTFMENTDDILFLSSVLRMIHSQLRLGFFVSSRDISILFRALVHVLDGRTDAKNEGHYKCIKDENNPRQWRGRFLLTEKTQYVMNTKVQILEIFDLIFNLRLHVRMSSLVSIWLRDNKLLEIEKEKNDTKKDSETGLALLLDTFDQAELHQRDYSWMPILKDILKYEYAPLQQICTIVMHRMFNDSQELFEKIHSVLLLDKQEDYKIYKEIKAQLRQLYKFTYPEDHQHQFLPQIRQIAYALNDFLSEKGENGNAVTNQIVCKIFKNLDACELLVEVLKTLLRMPFEDDHDEYIDTIRVCLQLLCSTVKNDKDLQSHFVLHHMELLIDCAELSPTLAPIFSRFCSKNLQISTRIKEKHIIRILSASGGQHGQYMLALHDILKTQGKPIKRNQDIVMRFIMDNQNEFVPFDSVASLNSIEDLSYCISLISVLTVCGQGENTFGQSFARTIFSIQDIYDIICDEKVTISLKSVMLKFLASIYIEDTELPSDIPIYDNSNIAKLIEMSEKATRDCFYNDHPSFRHFVFRGVTSFLRSLFENHMSIETTLVKEDVVRYTKLVDSIIELLPLAYNKGKALQSVLSCLDSMVNVSGFRGSMEAKDLYKKLEEAIKVLDKLHSHRQLTKKNFTATVLVQNSINIDFQSRFKLIKLSSAASKYQKKEFQTLCSHFTLESTIATGKSVDNSSVQSLISYLTTITTTKVNRRTEHYQVATIRILDNISNQYVEQKNLVNPNEQPALYESLESCKEAAQNTLSDLGCTLVAQNLLSSPRRRTFDAALKLLISLLEGGNKKVQDKLEEYFYSIREERFFYSFHHRLQTGIHSSKDDQIHLTRRLYKMNRQKYMLENVLLLEQNANELQPRSSSSTVSGNSKRSSQLMIRKRANSVLKAANYSSKTAMTGKTSDFSDLASTITYQDISQLMVLSNESTTEFETTQKDYIVMQDTMRTLQLMVEGHNSNLQTYLAKQPDNIKSFNIVLDVVDYLHAIVPLCAANNIHLIIQVLDTTTELAQGCLQNQVAIFNNKVINPVNSILKKNYLGCDVQLVNELKSKVVVCLLSLLEGGIENSETIYKEMADSLDLNTVKLNMEVIYKENLSNLRSNNVFEKLECGFLYCILVMTLMPALDQEQAALFSENNEAFDYFQSHTGKIEIVMDYGQEKQLTRVLFPIPEICQYLRKETKMNFLWNVRRESPSGKIEDFIEQSNMIIYEIENQAHAVHNKYLSFLTEYSGLWWKAAYGLTLLLNFLLVAYPNLLHTSTEYSVSILITLLCFVLGFAHLTLWLLLAGEFYFIQLPVLTNRRLQSSSMMTKFWATATDPKFLYHILMVILSLLGLIFPGFYSVHLLDFVFHDSVLQGVISSITLNSHSISRTAILGIIVVYIHSIIAYMYFRKGFDDTKGLFCGSLMECFITILSHGVRSGGGIGDILEPDELNKPSGWRTVFEMSFYLVVVVFLLNAIFGIIFDTFGHLRDERSFIQQDMKNSCFICSIEAVEFQRHSKRGFEDHVKNDHNIWQYMFFLVHLRNKDPTEYTGPESYVSTCLKNVDYSFFPINKALGLPQEEEDDKERIDKLEEMNHRLLKKLVALEENMNKIKERQSVSRKNSLLLSPM